MSEVVISSMGDFLDSLEMSEGISVLKASDLEKMMEESEKVALAVMGEAISSGYKPAVELALPFVPQGISGANLLCRAVFKPGESNEILHMIMASSDFDEESLRFAMGFSVMTSLAVFDEFVSLGLKPDMNMFSGACLRENGIRQRIEELCSFIPEEWYDTAFVSLYMNVYAKQDKPDEERTVAERVFSEFMTRNAARLKRMVSNLMTMVMSIGKDGQMVVLKPEHVLNDLESRGFFCMFASSGNLVSLLASAGTYSAFRWLFDRLPADKKEGREYEGTLRLMVAEASESANMMPMVPSMLAELSRLEKTRLSSKSSDGQGSARGSL